MNMNILVAVLVVSHAFLAGIVVFAVVFYFFPDHLAFGKWGFFLTAGVFPVVNYIWSHSERFLGITNIYLSNLVRHPSLALILTFMIFVALILGVAVTWAKIADRYRYVDTVNRAISLLDVNKLALPAPEDLAAAFALKPQRPEVPFILMRASRLFAFDDQPEYFYLYMDSFFDGLMKETKKSTKEQALDELAERYKDFERPTNLSIGEEAGSVLTELDPIHQLVNLYVEKTNPQAALDWSVKTLNQYRNRPTDKELILLRTILEAESKKEKLRDAYRKMTVKDPGPLRAMTQDAIKSINDQITPAPTTDFRSLAFLTDHTYQEALDYLVWLHAGGPEGGVAANPECAASAKIAEIAQRLLVLRARLVSRTDLIWWRPPTKLNLRYLYMHFGGQLGRYSAGAYETYDKCPGLIAELKKLYDAPAFKSFQDPEYWIYGTPLSSAFNGSAAITQLRTWLRLGW